MLDEMSYRKLLWDHIPITDFWRIGRGYAKSLSRYGIYTMGDVAKISIKNEELLYKLFGVNAELLIDHAWGWEPTTIDKIKGYKPITNSISSGQVLHCPYDYQKTRLIMKEMAEELSVELVRKKLVTKQIVITIGYDIENLTNEKISSFYNGEVVNDRYGRKIPKHSHGTENLDYFTSSTKIIMNATMKLFDTIVNKNLLVRRLNITANNVVDCDAANETEYEQVNLFTNYNKDNEQKKEKQENEIQKTMLKIKMKYGKNAVIKGMNLQEGCTAIERNKQIGGHKE